MSDVSQGPGWWLASDGKWYPPSASPATGWPPPNPQAPMDAAPQERRWQVRKYNQRMAQRMAKRAKLQEQGVAVCFAYNNLATAVTIGVLEDAARVIPTVGDLIELTINLVTFYFHRIVLVTDDNVYVFRDWPFHIPGKRLAAYSRHAGVVRLGSPKPGPFSRFVRRGQLTFEDGQVVYHGILWIRRAQYVAQEGNIPSRPYAPSY